MQKKSKKIIFCSSAVFRIRQPDDHYVIFILSGLKNVFYNVYYP